MKLNDLDSKYLNDINKICYQKSNNNFEFNSCKLL